MDISPEARPIPTSRQEFSDETYPGLAESFKIDAEAYAMSVVHGNVDLVQAVRPVLSGTSLVDWKMAADPMIPVAEKNKWQFIARNLPVDGAKSSHVINEVLNYIEKMAGKPDDTAEIDTLINKIETDLINPDTQTWAVTPTTRQDAYYRLRVLREVSDSVEAKAPLARKNSDTTVKAKALGPQLRFIEGALSSFLSESKPIVRPVAAALPAEVHQ